MGAEPGPLPLVPGWEIHGAFCCRGPFCHLLNEAGGLLAMLAVGFTGYTAEGFVLGGWSIYSGEPRLSLCSSKGVIAPAAARPM